MAYQQLAKVYDFLMEDAPYEQWVEFTEFFLSKQDRGSKKNILDLGCGTGKVTCLLAEKGHQLTGVDLSEDMLVRAASEAYEKNLQIQWIKQDIAKLEGLTGFDLVVSYCDVINYVTDYEQVLNTFKNAYQSLNDDGVFLFDVHNINYVKDKMVDQLFSEVHEDLAYIWFCEAGDHEGEMFHELTFFLEEDGIYQRFDESHHQRTYPISTYLELLSVVGFNHIEIYQDFNTDQIKDLTVDPSGERLFFACRKNTEN